MLGLNGNGQIGDNTTNTATVPVTPMNIGPVRSVSMRDLTTCAVDLAGDVWCWGRNDLGQAGIGTFQTSVLVPTRVQTATGLLGGANLVANGIDHSCAIVSGEVWCWGTNSDGQLGDNSGGMRNVAAKSATGLTGVVELVAAAYTTCAANADGDVWCWGRGTDGQIGDGQFISQPLPSLVFDACP